MLGGKEDKTQPPTGLAEALGHSRFRECNFQPKTANLNRRVTGSAGEPTGRQKTIASISKHFVTRPLSRHRTGRARAGEQQDHFRLEPGPRGPIAGSLLFAFRQRE